MIIRTDWILFIFVFMLNASSSLLSDYLSEGFAIGFVFFIYSAFAFLVFALLAYTRAVGVYMFFLLLFTYIYFLLWSFYGDPLYGMSKAFLGIIVPVFSVCILSLFPWAKERLVVCILSTCVFVFLAAILYKIPFGFFERSVRFGLFGSITFGWVMSFGAITALISLRRARSVGILFLLLIFLVSLIWSGSKGPLISFVVISFLLVLKEFSLGKILAVSFFFLAFIFLSKDLIVETRAVATFIQLFSDPENYISGKGEGSIGSRLSFYQLSYELFKSNPVLGVGFGGWGAYELQTRHFYPHNLFFEIMSEAGGVGMLLLSLMLFSFFRVSNLYLKYLILVSLFSLMFSGDFSYFRYPLFFILLGLFLERHEKIVNFSRRSFNTL